MRMRSENMAKVLRRLAKLRDLNN